jgi:probable rRNA maturation factor
MNQTLVFKNRQRVRRVDTPLLRRITRWLLEASLCVPEYELCVHLVGAVEMARVNETFLQHEGSTDVITFDHLESVRPRALHGELFICLDDAVKQAGEFNTTWQSELTRYVIHGLLHLRGHDDRKPAARRAMKREENRLLRETSRAFTLSELARK